MDNATTLKRGLTRWLVLQRVGKKPSTRHYHREIVKAIRRAWRPILERPLDQITDSDVTHFAIVAGHYSATRWNSMLCVLHAIVPAARSLRRRKVPIVDKRMLTPAEFVRLIEACGCLKKSHAGVVINFLTHTGMRIREARLLMWCDIFPDRIEVPAGIQKSGRPRPIPIVNGLPAVLDELRAIANGSPHVLPRPGIRRGLAKACAAAGLPPMSHHDFRHLFATRCIESGVDLPTVARWLGHKDRGALLARRYFHLHDDHSRRMAAKVQILGFTAATEKNLLLRFD